MHVDHVGAVVAVAVLDEDLGQDQLGRRRDLRLRAVDLDPVLAVEPLVGDRRAPFDMAKITSKKCSPCQTLAIQRSSSTSVAVAARLEVGQDLRVVAGLAEDVQVLGRAARCPCRRSTA